MLSITLKYLSSFNIRISSINWLSMLESGLDLVNLIIDNGYGQMGRNLENTGTLST